MLASTVIICHLASGFIAINLLTYKKEEEESLNAVLALIISSRIILCIHYNNIKILNNLIWVRKNCQHNINLYACRHSSTMMVWTHYKKKKTFMNSIPSEIKSSQIYKSLSFTDLIVQCWLLLWPCTSCQSVLFAINYSDLSSIYLSICLSIYLSINIHEH